MRTTGRLFFLAMIGGLCAQQGPPSIFELWLPDFFDSSFPGGKSLIEIPDRPISRLRILVRDAQQRNINPGSYRIFVNGRGIGNVFEERGVAEGTLLVMEPEMLKRRPDKPFDPRENALEIVAATATRKWYSNWLIRVNDSQQNSFFGNYAKLSPDDPKSVPPDLVLTEPSVPPLLDAVERAPVRLKGRISRGAALSLNGKIVQPPGEKQIVEFEHVLDITPDLREIVLEAINRSGSRRQVIIPVLRRAARPARVRFAGRKYAVVIGVSRFGSLKGMPPPIPLAAAEAEQFAERLQVKGGFKPENVRLLVDEKATVESVRVAFSDFAAKAQANDVLVAYLTTHGLHDPRTGRSERLYLALHGTQLAQLEASALAFSDFEILLNRSIRTNQFLLVCDLAHPLDEEWMFRGGRNLVNNHFLTLFRDRPGWSLLISGSADETSQTAPGSSSGTLFARRLLDGLGGTADINGDGVVTATELFRYVSENVKKDSAGMQTPRFLVPPVDDMTGFLQ